MKGYFVDQLPDKYQKEYKKGWYRNSYAFAAGSNRIDILLAGTTSGIEPVFEFEFTRHDRLGEHIFEASFV